MSNKDKHKKHTIRDLRYFVTMNDGSVWSIPVSKIAESRSKYYSKTDGDGKSTFLRIHSRETIPLFEKDWYEIEDWARNNMDWEDVKDYATLEDHLPVDYQEGWVNGESEVRVVYGQGEKNDS